MKNALGGLISRHNMAEDRISELKDKSLEASQTEIPKEKRKNKTSKNCRKFQEL